jgi:DNA-binding LytR/AlgR family response regulator
MNECGCERIEKDERRWLSRLSIRDEKGLVFVPVDQILWIEAANKFVVVHTTDLSHCAANDSEF